MPHLALNYLLLSSGEALSKILTFTAFAYLARLFGPDDFGAIEFAIALIFVFNLVADTGTGQYGTLEIAKDKNRTVYITGNIVPVRCLLAIASFILLVCLVIILNKPWPVKNLVLLYGLSIFGTPVLLQWVFQGRDLMQWVAIPSIIRQIVFTVGVFLWVREVAQTWSVAIVEVTAVISLAILNIYLFRRYFGPLQLSLKTDFCRSMLRKSIPLFSSQLMMGLKVYLPIIIIGMLLTKNDVGLFGSAHRIMLALYTFVGLYFFNILPSIARTCQEKYEAVQKLMGKSLGITAWVAIFTGISGTIFGKHIILTIYGAQYTESIRIFQVLIWWVSVAILCGHYRFVLIGAGKQQLCFLCTAAGATITIVLNILLLPLFGLLASAWIMVGSEILTLGLAYYFVYQKIINIPFLCHFVKPILGGCIMILVFKFLTHFNIWLSIIASIILYMVSWIFLQPEILVNLRSLWEMACKFKINENT